ncbi:MAG: outer membrane protein assembly factor BamA [Nitrospirae bacterium]|nr:MAG: outer membrane protein assembly factor BamA [Nitrospirota bacterium]
MLLWLTRGASRSGPTLVGVVLFRDGAPSRVSAILGIWGLLWVGLIWAYGQGIGVAQESAQLIKAIKIQGNKRIEAPAIRGRISLKEGEPFSAERIREQIRAIYQMGYFEDVRVETEPVAGGVAVMFVVSEKPFVTQILYDGNDNVKDEKLTEKLTVRPQSFLDQQQIKDSVERLRLLYEDEGYFSARIVPVIKTLDGERKSLTFFIKEGSRARIKTVAFDGARAVPDKKLKKALVTREYFWLTSWFDDAGIYKKDELANDVERLRQIYLDEGYLNVQVGTPSVELSPDKKWFTVRFPVVEGPQYTFSKISYKGQTIFSEAELRTGSKLSPGGVVRMAEIRDELTRVTDLYGTKGFAFADVNPQILPDPNSKTAAVTFEVKEEALVHVRNINISGNDKTRDKVIRRELRVNEAELIDTAALKRSYERLKNMNFFETVEIIPKQVDPNTVDLDVKVKEKSTGTFSVGGGFSSLDKLGFVADITEGNLFGRGQLLKIRGQLGQRRSLGVVTFREPYLFDEALSGQVDLFARETFFVSYFEERIGGDIVLGKWFSEYLSGSLSLLRERLTISNDLASKLFLGGGGETNVPISDLPPLIQQQIGTTTTDAIILGLARDTRDVYLDPSKGARYGLTLEFAGGPLGGSNDFYKYIGDAVWYFPVAWDTVFSPRARLGVAHAYESGSRLPVGDRFFVGGIQTVRGFSFGRAGPTASDFSPLGGNKQLIFNFDFIFPIAPELKVKGVVFFDYGKGFNDGESLSLDLRPATGFELRWISPFGPLRLAYGINLSPRTGERPGQFEFSVGTLF